MANGSPKIPKKLHEIENICLFRRMGVKSKARYQTAECMKFKKYSSLDGWECALLDPPLQYLDLHIVQSKAFTETLYHKKLDF